MTRVLNLTWKIFRGTTKAGKEAEDREKGGTEQEETNGTRDDKDRTRSTRTTEFNTKEE
jgi:hypothetical protein